MPLRRGIVRIDQLALLFILVIAANIILLLALQSPRVADRSSRSTSGVGGHPRANADARAVTGPDPARQPSLLISAGGLSIALYQRMTRVVSYMFIGAAMAIVVLTGMLDATAIVVLMAFGLMLVVLFQDVLPVRIMGRWRMPVEAASVLVFLTVLIALTGGQQSPYFFGYILLVGGAALSVSELAGATLALASSIAYIVAVAVVVAGGDGRMSPDDLGQIAFNLVAIALVMYVASVIGREQRKAREEALRLSRFDSMTALHSRDYFISELELEILRASRTGRPFALAMVDLDGLKAANDRFGHDWGDNLLRAVADVLRSDIRVTDVAARLGGDEFMLMLPETDLTGALLVAEKVRADIARITLPIDGAVIRTSASIGVVSFPQDGRTSAELMRRADMAMYEAKRRGRDQIVRFARDAGRAAPIVGPLARRQTRAAQATQSAGTAEPAAPMRTQAQARTAAPARTVAPARTAAAPVTARSTARPTTGGPKLPAATPGHAPWE